MLRFRRRENGQRLSRTRDLRFHLRARLLLLRFRRFFDLCIEDQELSVGLLVQVTKQLNRIHGETLSEQNLP